LFGVDRGTPMVLADQGFTQRILTSKFNGHFTF
jgi:hypothetical protein